MIYVISSVAGFINGIFSSGAGQIIIFYLVFMKKNDSHKSRGVSIFILSLSSVISAIFYIVFKNQNIDVLKCIIIAIISSFIGFFGAKIMIKIKANYLNLISGVLMTVLAIISVIRG